MIQGVDRSKLTARTDEAPAKERKQPRQLTDRLYLLVDGLRRVNCAYQRTEAVKKTVA
jgi:hypothetical protein